MAQAMDPCVLDMIVCEAQGEQAYLCVLLCKAHDGYTHQLYSEEDGSLATKLVEHRVVLPTVTQKLYALQVLNFLIYPFVSLSRKENMMERKCTSWKNESFRLPRIRLLKIQ